MTDKAQMDNLIKRLEFHWSTRYITISVILLEFGYFSYAMKDGLSWPWVFLMAVLVSQLYYDTLVVPCLLSLAKLMRNGMHDNGEHGEPVNIK